MAELVFVLVVGLVGFVAGLVDLDVGLVGLVVGLDVGLCLGLAADIVAIVDCHAAVALRAESLPRAGNNVK